MDRPPSWQISSERNQVAVPPTGAFRDLFDQRQKATTHFVVLYGKEEPDKLLDFRVFWKAKNPLTSLNPQVLPEG